MIPFIIYGIKLFCAVIFVTVYADILIILNTLVNYFMLLAVKKISRSHTKRWRIALGSFVGGISSLLIFLQSLGVFMTVLKLLSGVIMIFISFGFDSFKQFFKRIFWLFAICFLFGGVNFAIYILFDTDAVLYTNGIVYFDVNMTFLVICTVISYVIITVVTRLTDKKAPKSKEYFVTVQNGGKSVCCNALMDTGNSLCEPFSGYPVILAEKSVFNKLNGGETPEKIRLIPVSTVGGEALIKAFRPDSLKIGGHTTDKVYIGESLTPHEEYKIILNINLEGEMQNG